MRGFGRVIWVLFVALRAFGYGKISGVLKIDNFEIINFDFQLSWTHLFLNDHYELIISLSQLCFN
jgi:hypothetical protein